MAHSFRVNSLLLIESTLSVAQGGKRSQKKAMGERGYSLYSGQEGERDKVRRGRREERKDKILISGAYLSGFS